MLILRQGTTAGVDGVAGFHHYKEVYGGGGVDTGAAECGVWW